MSSLSGSLTGLLAPLKNLIAGLELCRALGIDFVSVTEAVDTSFQREKCYSR